MTTRPSASGAYVEDDDGGRYVLNLERGGAVFAQFTTASPAVMGAAMALMEWSEDPQALGQAWNTDLDVIGDALVMQAEMQQKARMAS